MKDMRLLQTASVYGFSNVINASVPFLLIPFLTRFLSPSDYGIVSMFSTAIGLFSVFVGINADGAVSSKFFKQDEHDRKMFLFTGVVITIASAAFVMAITFPLRDYLSHILHIPEGWIPTIVTVCLVATINRLVLVNWQMRGLVQHYAVFQIGQAVIYIALTILLLYLQMGWRGRIIGQLLSGLVFSAIGLIILYRRRWISTSLRRRTFHEMVAFGLPLVPHSLGGIILSMTDRVLLTGMTGIENTGLYTAGYQVGMVLSILSASFNQAYAPWLFKKLASGDESSKKNVVKYTYAYFAVLITMACILSLLASVLIGVVMGEGYESSSKYVVWIAFGYAFDGMYRAVVNFIFYSGKTALMPKITLSVAAFNIALSWFMIRRFGALGAAQATSVSMMLMFLTTWIASGMVHKMPWFEYIRRV